MAVKLEKKITGCKVKSQREVANEVQKEIKEYMHEGVERPDVLHGTTYKIKTPQSEHALYVTINDMVLNEDTPNPERHPYEIFINSKNMEHFQWVLATTRLMSAIWRKGGNTKFIIDEMKGVFDPKGGYFKRGGRYMPSLVAEIGYVIEKHLDASIEVDEHQREYIEAKRAELGVAHPTDYPDSATLCPKCSTKSVIIMDGCQTCLSCGDSKCG